MYMYISIDIINTQCTWDVFVLVHNAVNLGCLSHKFYSYISCRGSEIGPTDSQ